MQCADQSRCQLDQIESRAPHPNSTDGQSVSRTIGYLLDGPGFCHRPRSLREPPDKSLKCSWLDVSITTNTIEIGPWGSPSQDGAKVHSAHVPSTRARVCRMRDLEVPGTCAVCSLHGAGLEAPIVLHGFPTAPGDARMRRKKKRATKIEGRREKRKTNGQASKRKNPRRNGACPDPRNPAFQPEHRSCLDRPVAPSLENPLLIPSTLSRHLDSVMVTVFPP